MKPASLVAVLAALMLCSCAAHCPPGKYRVYLYKQPTAGGLVCVFYGNNLELIIENAEIFAELHKEKYGLPLRVRQTMY